MHLLFICCKYRAAGIFYWRLKAAVARNWKPYHFMCRLYRNSGCLNLLEPWGPLPGLYKDCLSEWASACSSEHIPEMRFRKHYFIPKIKVCGSFEALIPLYETTRRRVAEERNFVTPYLKNTLSRQFSVSWLQGIAGCNHYWCDTRLLRCYYCHFGTGIAQSV